MITQYTDQNKVLIANQKMEILIDYRQGLKLENITYIRNESEKLPWLMNPVNFFDLFILKQKFSSGDCKVVHTDILKDLSQEGIAFEMEAPVEKIRIRVSLLSEAEESFTLLYQMGAEWENDDQKEVFMHIPFFAQFGIGNQWYLSSNPVPRPDGRSAMCLHEEYDLPICNVAPDQKTGFSMEFRNYSGFIGAWNQNRNCDILAIKDEDTLKNNRLLLRLSASQLADVFEVRFFALNNGWCEAFDAWRQRIKAHMDLSEYARDDLKWYRDILYQHFTYAYSKEIFNYDTKEFEPERLIDDSQELGGIDSILLWFQYPRLGVDQRKQWDFNNDIPGGKAGVKRFCERAHEKGVKVFLPYKPWDIRFDESPESVVENIVDVVEQTNIDGIWFDTMDSVPAGFRERIDAVRPGVLFCTEVHPANTKCIETITGSWDQHMNCDDMPETFILRYMFPENNAPATNRWAVGQSKDNLIHRCIFNGTGIAVWQDIFGAWLPFGPEHKKKLKHWKEILTAHMDTYFCSRPIPLYPTLQEYLYANYFPSDNHEEIIYSIYNGSDHPVVGELLEVDANYELVGDLWANRVLTVNKNILVGQLEPGEVMIACMKRRNKN